MSAEVLAQAERCEAATGTEQYQALEAAWTAINGREPNRAGWFDQRHAFQRMLAVGAFIDAALTLVPEGCRFIKAKLERHWPPAEGWYYEAMVGRHGGEWGEGSAATVALAICAAALRARAAQ